MRVFLFLSILIISISMVPSYTKAAETLEFRSLDGLKLTADLYTPEDVKEPRTVVVMFHQAGSSRGEYKQIAPVLNDKGHIALAVDLRAGDISAGITNKTAERARKMGMGVSFQSAYPDLVASVIYAKQELRAERIILWGSSYSASLSILAAAQAANDVALGAERVINGVIAFSPGEYFNFAPSVYEAANNVDIPVFISSARSEKKEWIQIFEALPDNKRMGFIPAGMGSHGSAALISRSKDEYWKALDKFFRKELPFKGEEILAVDGENGPGLSEEKASKFNIYLD